MKQSGLKRTSEASESSFSWKILPFWCLKRLISRAVTVKTSGHSKCKSRLRLWGGLGKGRIRGEWSENYFPYWSYNMFTKQVHYKAI